MKVIIFLSCILFSTNWCNGQSVLDAVYYKLPDPKIRNGDTLWANVCVLILDSISKEPVKDITVDIYGSDGLGLTIKSDESGFVKYRIQNNHKYKIVCRSNLYETKMWELSTINISYPIKFDATIELVKK